MLSVIVGERTVEYMNIKKVTALVLTFVILTLSLCSCTGKPRSNDFEKLTPTDDTSDTNVKDPSGEKSSLKLLSALNENGEKGKEISEEFSSALGESAFELFSKAIGDGKQKENILISPLSVYIALAMTSCGAEGNTLSQIEDILGLDTESAARYIYDLNENLKGNETIDFTLANSVWIRNNEDMVRVNDDFLKVVSDYFLADVFRASFDRSTLDAINGWVEEKTNGMIKDMLSEIPDSVVMYLINALTFEAEWQEKYEETDLHEGVFYAYDGERIDTELMSSVEAYYLRDENAQGFIKPYEDRGYAFVALLPTEETDIYDYAASLTGERFAEILDSKERAIVSAKMPQFKYEYEDSLKNELFELGMTDAFCDGLADFSGMATSSVGNIYISDVLHKTFIEVSPKGTKAGAATVVIAAAESAEIYIGLEQYEVFLDRPFVYAIVDIENGLPIFIGVLSDIAQ